MQTGEDEGKHTSRCVHVNGASGANIPAIVARSWMAALKRSEGRPTGDQTATSSGKLRLLMTPNDGLCAAINE